MSITAIISAHVFKLKIVIEESVFTLKKKQLPQALILCIYL